MQFKIDENLPVDAARTLIAAGFGADTVIDEELSGKSDDVIAEFCRTEGRALITLDLGFADIRDSALGIRGVDRAPAASCRSAAHPHNIAAVDSTLEVE
jgi:predicted nuclease of predicted toxin-antitoxin system